MDCIFCKIVAGEVPAKIIFETQDSLAFMDAFPLAPGHSLVIPKSHYEKIRDIPARENADLFETVRKTIARVDEIAGATLLAVHDGRGSGQEIPHVHVHLVPRNAGDGAGPIHDLFKDGPQIAGAESSEIFNLLRQS